MTTTLENLLRLCALDRLPRTGWVLAGVPQPESVAAHSLGVALTALFLGPRVEPALAVERAVTLAIVHDAPEALLTDLPRTATRLLGPQAKARAEDRAAEDLLAGPGREAFAEYRAQLTREARFVRLCDRLHLGLQVLRYGREGTHLPPDFRTGLEALDCSEFEPCQELQRDLIGALAQGRAG